MLAVLVAGATTHAMAASAVSVYDGMSLHALAAAAKRADIRICLTVTEHFGYNGLGDTIAFRMLPLKFAIAHEPLLSLALTLTLSVTVTLTLTLALALALGR